MVALDLYDRIEKMLAVVHYLDWPELSLMVVVDACCFRQPYNKKYFKSFKFLKYKIQNKVKTSYFHRQFRVGHRTIFGRLGWQNLPSL
jgi:hypothetical protein